MLSSIHEDLGYLRPSRPVLIDQLQQSNVLFDGPLILLEGRTEMVAPPLPALLGGPHEPERSIHAIRHQLPIDGRCIFPSFALFHLLGEFLYFLLFPGGALVAEFELEDLELIGDDALGFVDEKPAEKAIVILALYNSEYT